jgi:hypothetical protein|tara:strand:+ start:168 stop:359 length:192 start_codon:yes stop_codon:yes gene_type:complete
MTEKQNKESGRKWDGRSRPSNDLYKKNYDEIFKEKTLHEELMEGFEKEQADLEKEEAEEGDKQ